MRQNVVVIIRSGGPDDAAAATELFSRADAARDGRPAHTPTATAIENLRARFAGPGTLVLLGYDGDELVATAMAAPARAGGGRGDVIPGAAHVSLIGVAPGHWGRGYGRTILQALTERLRAAGLERLSLSVIADNARARRLYERCGWRPDGPPAPHPDDPETLMQAYGLPIANRNQ